METIDTETYRCASNQSHPSGCEQNWVENFLEQAVTIQHAFDPEIWLKNQTIFKRNYERHRAKVSIEGIVLIVVGSALGIPGVGLLLLGFIKAPSARFDPDEDTFSYSSQVLITCKLIMICSERIMMHS